MCIDRCTMSCSTLGIATFTPAISARAACPPTLSSTHAACNTCSRNCFNWIHESAIISWTICFFESCSPFVTRDSARSQILSNAYFAWLTARIAWWMRPPPSRVCAMTKAWPSPPSTASFGTRTSS